MYTGKYFSTRYNSIFEFSFYVGLAKEFTALPINLGFVRYTSDRIKSINPNRTVIHINGLPLEAQFYSKNLRLAMMQLQRKYSNPAIYIEIPIPNQIRDDHLVCKSVLEHIGFTCKFKNLLGTRFYLLIFYLE